MKNNLTIALCQSSSKFHGKLQNISKSSKKRHLNGWIGWLKGKKGTLWIINNCKCKRNKTSFNLPRLKLWLIEVCSLKDISTVFVRKWCAVRVFVPVACWLLDYSRGENIIAHVSYAIETIRNWNVKMRTKSSFTKQMHFVVGFIGRFQHFFSRWIPEFDLSLLNVTPFPLNRALFNATLIDLLPLNEVYGIRIYSTHHVKLYIAQTYTHSIFSLFLSPAYFENDSIVFSEPLLFIRLFFLHFCLDIESSFNWVCLVFRF